MFRQKDNHLQQELHNSYTTLDPRIQKKLKNSWAPLFYEHVFCKIDEKPFAILYSRDRGRFNYPVNILLSLEFIKHIFDYTDEVLLDQYYFNYQVMYALGERNLGERYLGPRTFYEFRSRVYRYTIENPEQEDLIFGQFEKLTDHFIKVTGINTKEQRVDSTQIMPNIKLAGRLSLAYDILVQALRSCPEDILTENLKEVLKPDFKKELLYKCRSSQIPGRLVQIINLISELLKLVKTRSELTALAEIALLERFLKEQADLDEEQNCWLPKENKDISATSIQSAYDPDATFRNKGGKHSKGYVVNIVETCAEENPVQLITDYTVKPNSESDARMLEERLPEIKEKTELIDMYADGGYYSEGVETQSHELKVNMHYTDMTGKKPEPEKIPLSDFQIDEHFNILSCPENYPPLKSNFKQKTGIVNAHFNLEQCEQCPQKERCPVKFQKQNAILRVNYKSILAAKARERTFQEPLRREATSKRAAVEGTNSALKRSQGADKLEVRTYPKVRVVIGLKMTGRNIRQIFRYFQGKIRKKAEKLYRAPSIGVVCTS